MGEFEVYQDAEGMWRFRLRAGNGEIVCASEAYADESNATRGVYDLVDIVQSMIGDVQIKAQS